MKRIIEWDVGRLEDGGTKCCRRSSYVKFVPTLPIVQIYFAAVGIALVQSLVPFRDLLSQIIAVEIDSTSISCRKCHQMIMSKIS